MSVDQHEVSAVYFKDEMVLVFAGDLDLNMSVSCRIECHRLADCDC